FDAVEVFAPGPAAIDTTGLRRLLDEHGLSLAAVGTGAGWLIHRLTLTSAEPDRRAAARRFIASIIDLGGPSGAPAIIGSMQGRSGGDGGLDLESARACLCEALDVLGAHAAQYGVPLFYETLNRYETNMACTLAEGAALLDALSTRNVALLADLF